MRESKLQLVQRELVPVSDEFILYFQEHLLQYLEQKGVFTEDSW